MTDHMHDAAQSVGMREALEQAKTALFKIRACSIVGCEQGYGHPEKWADALFASHADVAAALKAIDAALASQPSPAATVDRHDSHIYGVLEMEGKQAQRSSAGNGDDLLPCPFCGGRANIYENEVDFVTKWSVGCGDCNCNMDVCEDTKTEAAACWNARTGGEPQTGPDLATYVSQNVFDGTRPLSSERVEKLKAAHGRQTSAPPSPLPRPHGGRE